VCLLASFILRGLAMMWSGYFAFAVGVSAYGSAFYWRSWFNQLVLSDDGCDGGKWSEKFAVA